MKWAQITESLLFSLAITEKCPTKKTVVKSFLIINVLLTVISGRLPVGNVLIFLQTVVGAGYRKVRVM